MFELGSPISCRQYVWPDIVQKNLCFDADKNMAEVLIDHSLNRLNDPNVHKDRHPFFENQIKEQQILSLIHI